MTMRELLSIEIMFGRRRRAPNAPRTLDLDLIAWRDVRRSDRALTLPHPRALTRDFVMQPLAEIAPAFRLPGDALPARMRAMQHPPLARCRKWW